MTSTLDHYNQNATGYTQANHSLTSVQPDREQLLEHLNALVPRPTDRRFRLLDAGSGSGRDTLVFMEAGLEVDAFDGSQAMAAISTELTGKPTRVMTFENLDLPQAHYDAIWAMASLLHVAREDLPAVMAGLGNALVPGGVMYASFKHGTPSRRKAEDGRAFTDMDEHGMAQLLGELSGLDCVVTTCRESTNVHRPGVLWFSAILKRRGPEPVLAVGAHSRKPRGPR